MTFSTKLISKEQANLAWSRIFPKIESYLSTGQELRLTIEKEKKSREQEEMYHAIINDIAKQASHQGAIWDADDWKRLLLYEFAREMKMPQGRIVPSLDGGGIVQLGIQSRKFTKEQATQFIEFLHAWAANAGIDL